MIQFIHVEIYMDYAARMMAMRKIFFYTFLKGGRIQLRDFIHVEISADFAVCISAYTHI